MSKYNSNNRTTIDDIWDQEGRALRQAGFEKPDTRTAPDDWVSSGSPAFLKLETPVLDDYQSFCELGEIALEG